MKNFLVYYFLILLLTISGCRFPICPTDVVEGTNLTIGIYVPVEGSIYGVQFVNYLSGRRIKAQTNICLNVQHSMTNSTLGIFHLEEQSTISLISTTNLNNTATYDKSY